MADPAARNFIEYSRYQAIERETGLKHEWLDGQVFAMAGGTPAHSRLSAQMVMELGRLLGERPCGVYSSDLKIRVPRAKLATYADAAVICGDFEAHAEDANAAINPTVLVEVLSDSTEQWDRTGKFRYYRKLASLKDYVLVSQHERLIEVFSRNDDGTWLLREAADGQRVRLSALDAELDVDRVYRGVTLVPDPRAEREGVATSGA